MLVVRRHASNAGCRAVPPLLVQQKGLINYIKGPTPPRLGAEAVILRQRLDAVWRGGVAAGLPRVGGQTNRLAGGLLPQLLPFAGRRREMKRPVGVCKAEAGRRDTSREPAESGMKQPVAAGWQIDLSASQRRLRHNFRAVANRSPAARGRPTCDNCPQVRIRSAVAWVHHNSGHPANSADFFNGASDDVCPDLGAAPS